MAKKFYESKFPNAKLQIAFKREKIKNRFRMFYYKNLRFLKKYSNLRNVINTAVSNYKKEVKKKKFPTKKYSF